MKNSIINPDADLFYFANDLHESNKNKFDELLEIAESDKDFRATVEILAHGEELTSRGQIFAYSIQQKRLYEQEIERYISERQPKLLLNAMMLYWGIYIEAKHTYYSRAYQSEKEEHKYVKSVYGAINSYLSHAETNEMKAEIIEDYNKKKSEFDSKDDAAEYFKTQYPLKFATIRKYLRNL